MKNQSLVLVICMSFQTQMTFEDCPIGPIIMNGDLSFKAS